MFKQNITRLRPTLVVFLGSFTIYVSFLLYKKATAEVEVLVKTSARNGPDDVVEVTSVPLGYLHPQNLTAGSVAPNSSDISSLPTTRGIPTTVPTENIEMKQQTASILSGETTALAIPYPRYMVDVNDTSHYDVFLKTNMENKIGCQNASSYDAIMGVHSAPGNVVKRESFRWLYADLNKTYPYKVKVWFFVGKVESSSLQSELVSENEKYGDLVQGNFIDSYKNLTYKAIFAFKWLNDRCVGFRRLLRLDDDVFMSMGHFFNIWNARVKKEENTIMCDALSNDSIGRDGKWLVTKSEISEDKYNFPHCMGYFVALTPDLVPKMEATARRTRFFWIDDVFMYGFVAKKVGANFENVEHDIARWNEDFFVKCLTSHDQKCNVLALITKPEKFQMLYSLMQNKTSYRNKT